MIKFMLCYFSNIEYKTALGNCLSGLNIFFLIWRAFYTAHNKSDHDIIGIFIL